MLPQSTALTSSRPCIASLAFSRCDIADPATHPVDTDDPSNLNDSDLSPIDFKVTPPPSNILTDSTADRVRVAMARQARKVFDAVVLRKDLTYETGALLCLLKDWRPLLTPGRSAGT